MIATHRWQKTALAAAVTALLGLSTSGALALSLGRLTIQSALGEPLRAEIEVPDITPDEAASLKTGVATPEAFVAAGLEYNAAMTTLQTSLQRRSDGRVFIRLSSDRPITEPFVDMILEANWSSGRVVRDYTMLFDPPLLRQAEVAPTLPQTSAPAAAASPDNTDTAAAAKPPAPTVAAANGTDKPKLAPVDGVKKVVVKPGDTASKIAGNTKSPGISLDQMLVALLRSNPDAFIKGNINRIRSGVVMDVPGAEQANETPAAEATQIVQAQSKDFNDFRRNLASNVATAAVGAADRKASGSIETNVEDKKSIGPKPDKLTLSKGALQAKESEEKIARERADKEAEARAAEIAKNISDLKKLGTATVPEVAATAAPAPAPEIPAPPAPPPVVPAPAKAPVAPVITPPAEGSSELLDELLANPLVPAAAGGLVALLGGLALYRIRQKKKKATQVDSSFLESRLQPESFFGASGGQRVDTSTEGAATGSSMMYSPSQLDGADDVDPIAEADVYLAYGRDQQAEDILQEAAKTNPSRVAIHTKLLEIFAKRRDARNFEVTATTAYQLTGSSSPEWTRICEMGLGIDPTNPLYQPGGSPADASTQPAMTESASDSGAGVPAPIPTASTPAASSVDLDLDLDFSLDDEPTGATGEAPSASLAEPGHDQTIAMTAVATDNGLDMDFELPAPPADAPSPAPDEGGFALPDISLSMDEAESPASTDQPMDLDFSPMDLPAAEPAQQESVAPPPAAESGMLEFDLGSLSLDLDTPSTEPHVEPVVESTDPLETKLALADEFVSIGDEDGARALIEEVISEASGETRAKAQRALANLS